MFFFWFLIIIFSFLQATFLSVDVVTGLVVWVLLTWPTKRAWVNVCIAGVVVDVIAGREVGWLSLVYLGLGMGLWLYRKQYYPFHALFLFLFAGGALLVANGLLLGKLLWFQSALFGLLMVAIRGKMVEQNLGSRSLKIYN